MFNKLYEELYMSTLICNKCGRTTNSAVSRWQGATDGTADGCFARVNEIEDRWEKGCSFDKADKFMRAYASVLFGKNINWNSDANKELWMDT